MKIARLFVVLLISFGLFTPVFADEPASLLSGTTLVPLFAGFVGAVSLVSLTYFDIRHNLSIFMLGLLLATYATGFIHLVAGADDWNYLLMFNGLGYIVLAVALVFPRRILNLQTELVVITLAGYTLITILGYFITHPRFEWLGMITKLVEIGLLICLGFVYFRERDEITTFSA